MSTDAITPKPPSFYQTELESLLKPKVEYSFSEPRGGEGVTWTCRIWILNKQVCTRVGKSQEEARDAALEHACLMVKNGIFRF